MNCGAFRDRASRVSRPSLRLLSSRSLARWDVNEGPVPSLAQPLPVSVSTTLCACSLTFSVRLFGFRRLRFGAIVRAIFFRAFLVVRVTLDFARVVAVCFLALAMGTPFAQYRNKRSLSDGVPKVLERQVLPLLLGSSKQRATERGSRPSMTPRAASRSCSITGRRRSAREASPTAVP